MSANLAGATHPHRVTTTDAPRTSQAQIGATMSAQHHQVSFYDGATHFTESVAGFVLPALRTGGVGVVAGTPQDLSALDRRLAQSGIDVSAARHDGAYVTVDTRVALDAVTIDGRIDAGAFQRFALGVVEAAAERGAELRISGRMASTVWAEGDRAGALLMESLLNHLPTTSPFQLQCTYPMELFDGEADAAVLAAMCELHQEVLPVEHAAGPDTPGQWQRTCALLEHRDRSSRHECDRLRREHDQLEAAIRSRDVIGQAKGILMARHRVDDDEAFRMLRVASNRSQRKLRDLAGLVVDRQLRSS